MLEIDSQNHNLNITKFISGLTICAFFLGIIYPIIYYSFFHFNVFDYIELNEIITHIIRDGVFILLPYILIFFVVIVYKKESTEIAKSSSKSLVISSKWLLILRIAVLLLIIFFVGYTFHLYFNNKETLPTLLSQLITSCFVFVVDFPKTLRRKIPIAFGLEVSKISYMFLNLLTLTLYGGVLYSLGRVDSVKNLNSTAGTYIIIERDTIKSNKTYYYIGKTNKYVFFYNCRNQNVDVYPDKNIRQYSLH